MLAAFGEPQHGLLSNGCASLRDAERAEFFDPCEPSMEVESLTFHAKQTRPRERPAPSVGAHHFAYSTASLHASGAMLHRQSAWLCRCKVGESGNPDMIRITYEMSDWKSC
jgi:hypothetical protein